MCQTKTDDILQEMMWLKSKGLLTKQKKIALENKLIKERSNNASHP
jgi:hypothetical protein